jgi:PASTA domain-containing protein
VDPAKRVEKLRKKYERELAASESRRVAYHQEVLGLLQQGGPDFRRLAEELGLLAQPVQQQAMIASRPRLGRRGRMLARAAGAIAGLLLLFAVTLGALRVARVPPFTSTVRVPRVMDLREGAAIQRLRAAGVNVRVLLYRRSMPSGLFHRVLGVSQPAGTRVAKGSTVTLYVAVAPKSD